LQWQRELESILSESQQCAHIRESSAFEEAAGSNANSIVLVGAGNLGRMVLRGLRSVNLDVTAFADSNPQLWSKHIDGVPVLSPESAAQKFGASSVFVVCIWHPDRQEGVQYHMGRMIALGAARTVPFVWLFWKYPSTFLPYYLWDLPSKIAGDANAIWKACESLEDECAKAEFVSHVRFRSCADFSRQCVPDPSPAYFPDTLFDVAADEEFVDCGAFDGDTIQSFVKATNGSFWRIHAFESDPENFAELEQLVNSSVVLNSRVHLHRKAVSSIVGTVRFSATGAANAAISTDGELQVECTTLDESLRRERPTFIKMDIEGAEQDALRGGAHLIRTYQPLLAICIYHRQSDLWRIPLLMRELEPESLLTLRSYWLDGFDLVCFAVPPNRWKQQRRGP
jgi:FkbM family methyltransferase